MRDACAQLKVTTRPNAGSTVLALFCNIDCMGKEKTRGRGIEGKRESASRSWLPPMDPVVSYWVFFILGLVVGCGSLFVHLLVSSVLKWVLGPQGLLLTIKSFQYLCILETKGLLLIGCK